MICCKIHKELETVILLIFEMYFESPRETSVCVFQGKKDLQKMYK